MLCSLTFATKACCVAAPLSSLENAIARFICRLRRHDYWVWMKDRLLNAMHFIKYINYINMIITNNDDENKAFPSIKFRPNTASNSERCD